MVAIHGQNVCNIRGVWIGEMPFLRRATRVALRSCEVVVCSIGVLLVPVGLVEFVEVVGKA